MKKSIKEILRKQKKTQLWLAQQIGTGEGYVNKVANGKVPGITTEFAKRIAKALNCQVEDIF